MMKHHEYLGDGVYAMFDGHQVWLTTGAHTNAPLVALEPRVMDALNGYARRVFSGEADAGAERLFGRVKSAS